ncbi:MAG: element excision factor XisH family protein [Anaerolineae bacterium]|nr:element excision factor XisH family protein [Anaerolineae bacterium]
MVIHPLEANMPAKDKYHDTVVNALKKDGWCIVRENVVIGDATRQLFIDILAKRENDEPVEAILVEVKVFEGARSPMTYLEKAIGQYMLYLSFLDYVNNSTPLYLAVPSTIYNDLLSEDIVSHAIQFLKIKLVIFDPRLEQIVKWRT